MSTIALWCSILLAVATMGIALATVVLALATRRVALATDAGTRAQIVSGARLAWIDAMRDAVAELLSIDAELKSERHVRLSDEFVDNLIQRRLMIRHRIEFRLDREKPQHRSMLKEIDALIASADHAERTVLAIRTLATEIAETEWRRVRREVGAVVSADALGRGVLLVGGGGEPPT